MLDKAPGRRWWTHQALLERPTSQESERVDFEAIEDNLQGQSTDHLQADDP
jgi:hypothetical protein